MRRTRVALPQPKPDIGLRVTALLRPSLLLPMGQVHALGVEPGSGLALRMGSSAVDVLFTPGEGAQEKYEKE
jgi:hypothetical protein